MKNPGFRQSAATYRHQPSRVPRRCGRSRFCTGRAASERPDHDHHRRRRSHRGKRHDRGGRRCLCRSRGTRGQERPAGGAGGPGDIRVHEHIRDVCRATRQAWLSGGRTRTLFPLRRSAKSTTWAQFSVTSSPGARCPGNVGPRCLRGLGRQAWRRCHAAGDHRLLLGRPGSDLAVRGAQPRAQAGVARYGRIDGAPSPLNPKQPIDVVADIKAPVLGLYGATRHSGIGRGDASRALEGRQDRRVRDLP